MSERIKQLKDFIVNDVKWFPEEHVLIKDDKLFTKNFTIVDNDGILKFSIELGTSPSITALFVCEITKRFPDLSVFLPYFIDNNDIYHGASAYGKYQDYVVKTLKPFKE